LNKKTTEDRLEALRLVKEVAEQPEKQAKERHLKAWEGKAGKALAAATVQPARSRPVTLRSLVLPFQNNKTFSVQRRTRSTWRRPS